MVRRHRPGRVGRLWRQLIPVPHLHRDWAHPCPHLRRDWAHPCHICTRTGLAYRRSIPADLEDVPMCTRAWRAMRSLPPAADRCRCTPTERSGMQHAATCRDMQQHAACDMQILFSGNGRARSRSAALSRSAVVRHGSSSLPALPKMERRKRVATLECIREEVVPVLRPDVEIENVSTSEQGQFNIVPQRFSCEYDHRAATGEPNSRCRCGRGDRRAQVLVQMWPG
jgi:hypothetical protein